MHIIVLLFVALIGVNGAQESAPDAGQIDSFVNYVMSSNEPLSDEDEAVLQELFDRGLIDVDENGIISVTAELQPEIELVMEPADKIDPVEELHQIAKNPAVKTESKKDVVQRRGQAEYETWIDPEYNSAAMHAQKPTVDVKRARELRFDDAEPAYSGNAIFLGIVGVCATVALMGTAVAGVAYYKLHKQHELSKEHGPSERRAVQGSVRGSMARGDQRNAYSAQLNHYQQTKNEIIRMEQANGLTGEVQESEESDQEGDEPDYSVYECPGLAPTGDIEVSNPMFNQKDSK